MTSAVNQILHLQLTGYDICRNFVNCWRVMILVGIITFALDVLWHLRDLWHLHWRVMTFVVILTLVEDFDILRVLHSTSAPPAPARSPGHFEKIKQKQNKTTKVSSPMLMLLFYAPVQAGCSVMSVLQFQRESVLILMNTAICTFVECVCTFHVKIEHFYISRRHVCT